MDIIKKLSNDLQTQESWRKKLQSRKKVHKGVPAGRLKVTVSNGVYQHRFKPEGEDDYQYVPVSEDDTVKAIAQKDYEEKLLGLLNSNCKCISRFLADYRGDLPGSFYETVSEGRRRLIDPLFNTDEKCIEAWYKKYPGEKNTFAEKGKYLTERGEMVRSKSEKILADLFYSLGIPYVYEPLFILKNGEKVCPDFILFNIRERRTCVWEHLGLIADGEYASKNLKKILGYEKSGYILGDNLIISEETPEDPLDITLVKTKLSKFFGI